MLKTSTSSPSRSLALPALLLAAAVACAEPPAEVAGETPAETAPNAGAEPAPIGPVSSRGEIVPGGGEMASGGDSDTIAAPGARFRLPERFERETPSSSMRMAQARIDGPGGPAQLTAFFFGPGGGGGVEANLTRWIDQVETSAEPRRERFERGGFTITWVEVAGTIKPSTMGVGPTTPQPDSLLLGAVVEGPGGPWFFKATGPAATLEAARDEFLAMLESVEAAP